MLVNSCICSLTPANMVSSYVSTRRVGRVIFMEFRSDISGVVSISSHSDVFAQAMIDVGPPED